MKECKDFRVHNGLYVHNKYIDCEQWKFKFDNGYGLAVLKHDELCYDTPITDDVIGYLTSDEVYDLLDRIEQL